MITIVSGDSGAARPYANLLPLVEKLRRGGNALMFDGDGFLLLQDGWCCELRDPIDFEVVQASFVLPDSIVCVRHQDRIVDRLTRSEISGPGERGLGFGAPDFRSEPWSTQREKLRQAWAPLPDLDRYLLYGRYLKQVSTRETSQPPANSARCSRRFPPAEQ